MPQPEPEIPHSLLNVCMTLFVVEHGDSLDDPGYIVRFLTTDKSSHARLGGLLFSLPEDRARHLINNVWWVHEETMELLVKTIPALSAQIAQLADGDPTLPSPQQID